MTFCRWLTRRVWPGVGLTIVLAGPLTAQLDYNGSVEVASGSYIFAERATGVSFSNGLYLRRGSFFGGFDFPLVYQNSSAISYVAGMPVPTGGPEHGKVRDQRGGRGQGGRAAVVDVTPPGDYEAHVGDPRFGVGADLYEGTGVLRSISVETRVKAPLADLDSGVGTGEWDVGAGASGSLEIGSTFLFADVMWWRLGDLPELDLKDPLVFGLGVGRTIGSGNWTVLASWSGATRMIDGVDPEHSVGLAFSRLLGYDRSLSAGLSVGLTESGSDFAAYVAWTFRLHDGGQIW